jgi:hypothetical protein
MRRGINQHTLEKICSGESVRANKLAECLKALEEYERGQCIMKRRPLQKVEAGCGAPPLRCAVQGLRSATAALGE